MASQTLNRLLSPGEQREVAYALESYRRADFTGWNEFRNKLSPALVEKWDTATAEARRNGFVGPYSYYRDGSLHIGFYQILQRHGASVRMDECAMCERGNCRTDKKGDFYPCWADDGVPF